MEGAAGSAFERIKENISKFKEKDPRTRIAMDAASKRDLVEQVTAALLDPTGDVLDVLAEVSVLPAPVIAEGVGASWPHLAPDAKDVAKRWIASVASDKRSTLATRLAFLVLAGQAPDSDGAHQILLLAPDSKDSIARLAAEFFGADSVGLDRLRLAQASNGGPEIGLRLLKAGSVAKAQEYRRLKALQLVLTWAIGQSQTPELDYSEIVKQARIVRQLLTPMTAGPLSQWLARQPEVRTLLDGKVPDATPPSSPMAETLAERPAATTTNADREVGPNAQLSSEPKHVAELPTVVPTETQGPGSTGSDQSIVERAVSKSAEILRAEADALDKVLAQLRADRALLDERQRSSSRERTARKEAECVAASTLAKLHASEKSVQEATAARETLAGQLEDEQRRTADLASSLAEGQALRVRASTEAEALRKQVEELQIRVTANAEARLEELRARIGAATVKARRQVPDKLSKPNVDEGTIVLSRFYELLTALAQDGIKVDP